MIESPPRFFDDATLPPAHIKEDGRAYVTWLADHLFHVPLPIPEHLILYASKMHDALSPAGTIAALGASIGYAADDLEHIVKAANDGKSYSEFIALQIDLWKEIDDADTKYLHRWIVDPRCYAQVQEEEAQRRDAGQDFPMLDMPYRWLLARALKRIPEPDLRVEALHGFFGEFNDAWRE